VAFASAFLFRAFGLARFHSGEDFYR